MTVLVVWLVVAVLLAPVFAGIINSTTDGDLLFATTCGAFFGLAWPVTAPGRDSGALVSVGAQALPFVEGLMQLR